MLPMTATASPTFSTKTEARAWALRERGTIPPAAHAALSAAIATHLTASAAFDRADRLLTYVGAKDGELDTAPILSRAWAMGKEVLVPITGPGGEMAWSRLETMEALERTPLGLLEPRRDSLCLVEVRDGLCLVPGACFRHDGHRIGFGGGYYDRFLAAFGGVAMALSPNALFGVRFPIEPHDRPVSAVVTETGVHPTGGTTAG